MLNSNAKNDAGSALSIVTDDGVIFRAVSGGGFGASSYQWTRTVGGVTSDIAGATSQTYTKTNTDKGKILGCRAVGFYLQADGVQIPADAVAAPVNTTAPSVNGTPTVGTASSYTAGVWPGSPTVVGKWQLATSSIGASAVDVATAATYTPLIGDIGKFLGIQETATNAGGSVIAKSAVWKAVQAAIATLEYRVASYGLRLVIANLFSAGTASAMSRLRRVDLVGMSGVVELIMPLFYVARPGTYIREIDFPHACQIQVAIEPVFKTGTSGINTSPRFYSAIYTYDPATPEGFVKLEVDLGATVITKDSEYGIWTAYDNLEPAPAGGLWFVPQGARANSTQNAALGEYANSRKFEDGTANSGSFITKGEFANIATIGTGTTVRDCYAPCMIRCKHLSPAWVAFGSSSPEGNYDASPTGAGNGDGRGDSIGARGNLDKLFATRMRAPFLNLSKGSEQIDYIIKEIDVDDPLLRGRPTNYWRNRLAALANPTAIAVTIGSNDIKSTVSLASFRSMMNTHIAQVRTLNPTVPFYGATYTPKSASTDGYITQANQTIASGVTGNNPVRHALNQDLRNNSGELNVQGYIELCNAVETDYLTGTSKWVNNAYPFELTPDGTHPSNNGSALQAAQAVVVTY